ncbi:hypothetical protein [Kineococcus rubinsiae]|uniref:hypothetical protein n=1 Tax=Kineococcus rubinsiae TaxID=2609562 RepID=UPI00142F6AD1|nr:hypothetical protein [Kineococcus rubinsiae]NIZ92561.1 hypothetical protein [Kineococcus rubinsiae]
MSLVAGAWIVVSLFADGWAHTHLPDLESFFTPWHAALYSGLLANVIWLVWLSRPTRPRPRDASETSAMSPSARMRRGATVATWHWSPPAGYGGGVLGAVIFGGGGAADMAWHSAWGVEVGLDALLSPPHLVLLVGALLLVTSPWRASSSNTPATHAAATVSLLLAVALMAFFLIYTSEFASPALTSTYTRLPEASPGHAAGEASAILGLGRFLITTVLFVVPLLMLWRRPQVPTGSVSRIVIPLSGLSLAVSDDLGPALWGVLGASFGALVADVTIALLRRHHVPHRPSVLAGVATLGVWSGHAAALTAAGLVRWPLALTSGVVALSGLVAVLLSYLASFPMLDDQRRAAWAGTSSGAPADLPR